MSLSSRHEQVQEKRCTKCQQVKSLAEFYRSANNKYRPSCKDCCSLANKRAYRKNLRISGEDCVNGRRLSKYGLTEQEYEALLARSKGKCECCGKAVKPMTDLVIDHCHETGSVRGLLCATCNSGIGLLGDGKEGILAAMSYLRQAQGSENVFVKVRANG